MADHVKQLPKVKTQFKGEGFHIWCGDSCSVLTGLPTESVGFSVFSPPFGQLYSYSDSLEDLSNCRNNDEFFVNFEFIVRELFRLIMPGRIVAVHCMDLPTYKRDGNEIGLTDFSGDIIRLFQKVGFIFHSRHCIWKDPLVAATRTKAIGLAHKQICKDSAMCRMGIPDYIVAFRKPGENPKPIKHPRGLTEYYGSRSVPRELDRYIEIQLPDDGINKNPYDSRTDKRSHWIWQQFASPVWFDIRQTKVLPYKKGREEDDQKHICALQTDTVYRCLDLWSGKNDIVLTPFLGVGTEVYCAVKTGRRAIGCELKKSYFRQAVSNLKSLFPGSSNEDD